MYARTTALLSQSLSAANYDKARSRHLRTMFCLSLQPVKVLVSWEATTVPELCRAVRGEGFLQDSMQIMYWGSR